MDINFDDHRFRTLEIFPRNVSSLAEWDTTRIGQLSGPVHVEVKRRSSLVNHVIEYVQFGVKQQQGIIGRELDG